jgi:ATP-binding cassette subfamily C protein LapB
MGKLRHTCQAFVEAVHARYPWLTERLRPLKTHFYEVAALSLFINLLALAVPIFSLQVYDRVVAHQGVSTLVALLMGVLLALTFDFILRQTRSRMLQQVALHIDATLGRAIYDKFASLPLSVLETRSAHSWQQSFQEAQTIRTVLAGPTAVLATDLPFALVFLAVICVIATPVVWVLFLIIGAFLTLTWLSTKLMEVGTKREQKVTQAREQMLYEMMAGRATMKALRIDRALQPQWETQHVAQIMQSYERGGRSDACVAFGQTLAMLTTVSLVSVGALAIIEREMSMGALIATTMLSSKIIGPVNQLLMSWKHISGFRQSLDRLSQFFSLPSERELPTITRERPKGELVLEQVSFSYGDGKPVVDALNFKIKPGEVIGILGKNGCGKSTLLKLLQGLYPPSEGRILLDGIDLAQFSRKELADWIGYVPQECFLFSGTVKENIAKSWPEADDAAILYAAKLAGAEEFINDLPQGFATDIGEAGGRLSGGQRQRLSIARALIKHPPVLVFDELTNHLDSAAEAAMAATVRSLAPHHTVIVATHSMPMLRACHKLVVMERGKIAVAGPTADVLKHLTQSAPHGHDQRPSAA